MWEKAREYLKKAGTIILAISIILFLFNTYPEKEVFSKNYDEIIVGVENSTNLSSEQKEEKIANLQNEQAQEAFEYTISGRLGEFIQPIFAPLGFDARVSTATIGALAAKEVFVSQMGILYSIGEADEESTPLRDKLRANYSNLQAFCIMLFALLSIPCVATLAIIKKELGSWKYVIYESVGLFSVAWVITFIVYQVGTILGIGI